MALKTRISTVFFFAFSCFGMFSKAQDFSKYEKHNFILGKDTLPYRILFPENYVPSKKYPLILFLHGSGERGNDNEAQLSHGGDFFLKDSIRKNYPAIVFFPQCRKDSYWSNVDRKVEADSSVQFIFQTGGKPTIMMELLQKLLNQIMNKTQIERKQLYVGGLSMGGMGTFEIVSRNPKLFAAAFPMCGGANEASASKFLPTHW